MKSKLLSLWFVLGVVGILYSANVERGSNVDGSSITGVISVTSITAAGTITSTSGFVGNGSGLTNLSGAEPNAGSTNYVQIRDTLQVGTTFYVASGTVNTQLYASSMTVYGTVHSTTGFTGTIGTGALLNLTSLAYSGTMSAVRISGGAFNAANAAALTNLTTANLIGNNLPSASTSYVNVSSAVQNGAIFNVSSATITGGTFNLVNSSINFITANSRIVYNSNDGLGNACSKIVPISLTRVVSSNSAANFNGPWTSVDLVNISTNAKQAIVDVAVNQRLGSGSATLNLCEIDFRRDENVSASTGAYVNARAVVADASAGSDTAQRFVMVSTATFQYRITQQGGGSSICDFLVDLSGYCE